MRQPTTFQRRRRRPLGCVTAVLAATVAAAAGCSTAAPSPSVAHLTGTTGAARAAVRLTVAQSDHLMVEFARCLRAHGVPEPDPFHRPGHDGLSIEIPATGPATKAGLQACNKFLAPIVAAKAAGANAQLERWLPMLTRYAQCMRSHDIAMLDPDEQGSLNLGNVPGIDNGFGRYTPQFKTADAACRHFLPSGIHDDGTGP